MVIPPDAKHAKLRLRLEAEREERELFQRVAFLLSITLIVVCAGWIKDIMGL